VKEDGRLKLTPVGGLSPNNAEAENVKIHTRSGKVYDGTFQLVDASWHVNPNYESTARTFDVMEVVVDERTASAEQTRALGIEVGDFVSFDPRFTVTGSGYIKSRHLDDKLSSSILLAYAKMLREEGRQPARRIYLHFTVYEEIGHGASAFCPADVTEVIAVDMGCVGKGITCTEHEVSICVKDSNGPSDHHLVSGLVEAAKGAGVNYALDVYPFYGSDADAIMRSGFDARHCVIGAGVAASHGYERSHKDGLSNTYDLIAAYVEKSAN
jgi:putative aminopeptidase FrvX